MRIDRANRHNLDFVGLVRINEVGIAPGKMEPSILGRFWGG